MTPHGEGNAGAPLRRGVIKPALWTMFLLIVLIGLGVWQLRRLEWKNRLLAQIDQAEQQPAVALTTSPAPFEKVMVSGTWLSPVAHYWVEVRDTPHGPRMGSQLLVPLARSGRPAVLVLLGWVMDDESVVLPSGEVSVVGYVRPSEHQGWLSASDNVKTLRFFSLDAAAIGKALGVTVEPFTVVVLDKDGKTERDLSSGPAAATRLPRPLNNHLSYALTWFGLAGTLVVVFGLWVRKYLAG